MALTQTEVSELYVSIFNRASEGEGNKYWQTNQPDMVATANVMLATDAAKSYFGSSLDTDQAFIEHIYQNTLNKTATDDPDGISYWVNELSSGKSRGEVVVALINAAKLPANAGDAQDQFNNRVAVSNHMADTVETAPADYATSTAFATSGTTGLVVTNDSATVTSADAVIDALANPAVALTVDPDTLTDQLTTGDDTIDASTVLDSLNSGDIIIDNSTTDNDTLNAKITAQTTAIAPTIVNIENINLDLQGMSDVTYNATSTTNANITLLSTQFGFGGNGIVTGLKNGTTVTAGDKIENLDITTSAATDTATVVLSGDVTDLAIHTATSASISTTADATVNYTPDAITTTTITGDKSVTLKVAGGDVTAKTVTSELTAGEAKIHLTDATNVDATKFTVDSIVLGADGAQTISIVDGATVEVGVAQTATNIVTIDNGTAAGAYTANIKTGVNISELDVSDADLSTNLELTANSEIATLTSTDNNVTVTGTGNLNISGTIDADKLDASALNGKLDIAANSSDIAVLGGTGAATIAFAAGHDASFVGLDGGSTITSAITSGNTLSVQTGSGVDTLEQTASIAGLTLNAQLGAGDDVIKLTDTAATAADADTKIAIDMGAGNDTLELVDTLDLSLAGKLELVGLETIQLIDDATDGASATFAASQLDGLTSTIKGTSVAYAQDTNSPQTLTLNDDTGDILNVNLSATDTGVDLSTLTLDAVEIIKINQPSTTLTADLTIKGTATRDMITGGDGNDTIIAGEGQDEITGGKGNDTIDLTETQVEIGKDIVNLSAVADNGVDTIKAFAAGDGADIITIKGADTAAVGGGPGEDATIIGSTTGLVTDGAAWDISGTTDARDILEVTTTLDSTVSFTADSTGHDLLQALSSDTTEASEITLDSGVNQFLVAYQDGNAYLWHLDGTDVNVVADDIQLVAILENVSSGTVDTGDFVLA